MKINIVKPQVWNFKVQGGETAWEEVAYSAKMSGVPASILGEDIFKMIIENDYGSSLEHIILKFDLKMTKGNAPELLEHRMSSHSGYSTRYVKADKMYQREESAYEIIMPWHILKDEDEQEKLLKVVETSLSTYERMLDAGLPRESARYILPFCQAVGIYHFTMNLRSCLNFLGLRTCVRTSPEMRCLASQIYFNLIESLPAVRGHMGCRGFNLKVCPESNVTGVREGEPLKSYPICPFRAETDIFIPTRKQIRGGISINKFNKERALEIQEGLFKKWASWEG
ncbi:MAG: FAD-dependent thymidylate synthase [Candidatus Pacebacteria bacterium]|nr:FAD-dependent thymidylate synthase [Candidatus Paceibacterota bacterium]MDD4333829.1 FAD-dependent thymidylate synthase [Candidatus Paceibacterota bacterium]